MWQDIVISIVGFLFGFMMFPQVRDSWHGNHINGWSSGLTALGLFILVICFGSMQLWISTIAETFVGITWLVIWLLNILET